MLNEMKMFGINPEQVAKSLEDRPSSGDEHGGIDPTVSRNDNEKDKIEAEGSGRGCCSTLWWWWMKRGFAPTRIRHRCVSDASVK